MAAAEEFGKLGDPPPHLRPRAVIVANALLTDLERLRRAAAAADLVIAADGGSRHCRRAGIVPHHLIGDLDSTSPRMVAAWRRAGVHIHRFPPRKDQTDLELALDLALVENARDITLFGALGRRWDMTLANLMILTRANLIGRQVRLIDGAMEAVLVRGGETYTLEGRVGDLMSLVPAGVRAVGVSLSGFEFPLDDQTIAAGSTLGISNRVTALPARIRLREGALFCVVTHGALTPQSGRA